MGNSRRRTHLGPHASAALPTIWKALARKGWSHADFAREADITTAGATRILYGDNGVGRKVLRFCLEVLGVRLILWEKPCPPNWRPHDYPDLRPREHALAAQ